MDGSPYPLNRTTLRMQYTKALTPLYRRGSCAAPSYSTTTACQARSVSRHPSTSAENSPGPTPAPVAFDYKPQRKGRVSATRAVPLEIPRPPYARPGGAPPNGHPPPLIHDAVGIKKMRRSCAAAAELLSFAGSLVQPGITTDEIDRLFHDMCVAKGLYPSPLGYAGFPKSICTSLNEVVCHGIPDCDAVVHEGDLVKLDVSVYIDGVHGDNCRTFIAGGEQATDDEGRRLTTITKACLDRAITVCGPGVRVGLIGETIQSILDEHGFTAVRSYAGHGIGADFHTRPLVWHFGPNSSTEVLRPGMAFTIEPMVNAGGPHIEMWADGWTVVTSDGSRCAQFEHTLLVTDHGVEVLTAYDE